MGADVLVGGRWKAMPMPSWVRSWMGMWVMSSPLNTIRLMPLKSAKRLYCLGEYLATIELAAHVGEMLALLLWEATPITFNGKAFDSKLEKDIWGSPFEKMGQKNRAKLLAVFETISEEDKRRLDYLRTTRRKYFHYWSEDTSNIKDDALECYLKLGTLVKDILKLEIKDGVISMNSILHQYLRDHGKQAKEHPL